MENWDELDSFLKKVDQVGKLKISKEELTNYSNSEMVKIPY